MDLLRRSKRRIYADAAASTPLSKIAKAELVRLLDVYGNSGGLHQEGLAAQKEIEGARERVARTIGAHADEIFFMGSGTEANNLALQGILRPQLLERGEVSVITTSIEHSSVLEPLRALEKEGLALTELPVDREGLIDLKELQASINEQAVLVSIQLVNSEIGSIQPIREVAKILRKQNKKIYLHVDASQAPLWLKIGVEQLGIDMLTLDGQKIMGPKGVGVLYIRRGTDIEPLIYGGGQESGLRSGTPATPLVGAFGTAIEEAALGIDERVARIANVRDHCFEEIKKIIPDAILNGAQFGEKRVANNLNISIPGLEAQMAVVALDAKGIAASTRSACDVGSDEPSHVIKALGVPRELSGTAMRFTFLPDVTKKEANRIARALYEVALRYRVSF